MTPFLPPLLIAVLLTALVTPVVAYLARRWGLVDDPKHRYHPAHTHKGIVPRAGGLAILIGISVTILLSIPLTPQLLGILIGSVMLTIIGLLDDKKDVSPYIRLVVNAAVAILVVATGSTIPFITNPLTGGILPLNALSIQLSFGDMVISIGLPHILAIIWIVWTMNIIGWSAGVDGQMPGYVAISAFVLGLLSLRYSLLDPSQIWVTLLAFIVAGAYLGFLPWNFYPQRIMPGYGGKTLAGFYLALLGILSFAKLGTALLVLGIPMLDAVATLIRRIGNKKSPVLADRGHLHHKLLDLGWTKPRIALFYWGVSAILGLVSLTVTSTLKVFTFIAVAVALTMFFVWVSYFTQFSKQRDHDSG
ncbi:undecaprenyl/decaprenyl-phosphate alpha-N-acetylglucosaminyl 1-phosphate transferase [Candidatus Gottesmanbacteria bacterium]|nr:undecaprenyl/decaprenyl-phosphate alpha-N-acetylglucosaminyl 1-phosphate transferase [Candidatus Gottesmanbacteria bacterium]